MCKELCESTECGREIWDRWRAKRDNWKEVSEWHRAAVLAAMREDVARGGKVIAFLCPRVPDGRSAQGGTGDGE